MDYSTATSRLRVYHFATRASIYKGLLYAIKPVPRRGLEPPWIAPHTPEACASTIPPSRLIKAIILYSELCLFTKQKINKTNILILEFDHKNRKEKINAIGRIIYKAKLQ